LAVENAEETRYRKIQSARCRCAVGRAVSNCGFGAPGKMRDVFRQQPPPRRQNGARASVDDDVTPRQVLSLSGAIVGTPVRTETRAYRGVCLCRTPAYGIAGKFLLVDRRTSPGEVLLCPVDRDSELPRLGVGDGRRLSSRHARAGRLRRVESRHQKHDHGNACGAGQIGEDSFHGTALMIPATDISTSHPLRSFVTLSSNAVRHC
jgi:hypothetical protein